MALSSICCRRSTPTSASTTSLVKLSTRPEKRVGSDELWDKAEAALERRSKHKGLECELQPGEGAFYGPKIEFSLKDSSGPRLAVRHDAGRFLDAGAAGRRICRRGQQPQTPVMLHRAILGSLERFIGILIEHHAGALPLWLAPVQVVVLNITEHQAEYAREVAGELSEARLPRAKRT